MLLAAVGLASLGLTSNDLSTLIDSCVRPTSYLCAPSNTRRIQRACADLEASSERPAWPRDLMRLDGEWKLLFSSTLAGPVPPEGGIFGALPDPPEALLAALESVPFAPKGVRQNVDVMRRRVVNVVSISPWPSGMVGSLLATAPGPFGDILNELQSSMVRAEAPQPFRGAYIPVFRSVVHLCRHQHQRAAFPYQS